MAKTPASEDKVAGSSKPPPPPSASATDVLKNKGGTDQKPDKSRKTQVKDRRQDGFRETVESIVFAFVLAFLFRTFEAEAFVIPTGSMAETLYGRHKDVVCEKCSTHFHVSASDEIEEDGTIFVDDADGATPNIVNYAICPNCRYPSNVLDELSFNGDRILVTKFQYEFSDPQRWDVIVFQYPEDPKTNYIKRLVGLPGETIKIELGDVYARRAETDQWLILRKSPEKQQAVQILVYDNDKPAGELLAGGWKERWAALEQSATGNWTLAGNGWSSDTQQRTFRYDPTPLDEHRLQWIRYRHFVPYIEDWRRVLQGDGAPSPDPQLQLVTDFSSYNAGLSVGEARFSQPAGQLLPELSTDVWGVHWVGDLTLSCEVDVLEAAGELVLELVEGVRRYQCRFDLTTGRASLAQFDLGFDAHEPLPLAEAQTALQVTGHHRLKFANVDDRLCLWVDGRLIEFGEQAELSPSKSHLPTRHDLSPVGIAANGAKLLVSRLLLTRDIYYLSCSNSNGRTRSQVDFPHPEEPPALKDFLSDPQQWAGRYLQMRSNQFELGPDEFFVLGDNSPRSRDSRLWTQGRVSARDRYDTQANHPHAVPRELLIGKAFFIYWPHGIPVLNDGKGWSVMRYKQRELRKRRDRGYEYVTTRADADGRRSYVFEDSEHSKFNFPFYPQWWRWQRIR